MSIDREAAEQRSREQIRRQAIVLVHGMGEQLPMETVRDFATAVWASDRDLHSDKQKRAGELFSVPDSTTGSRELRRISTRKSRPRRGADGENYAVRNEFFELYWADSTADTTWADFLTWYSRLVFRGCKDVPKAVYWIWLLLWGINILFLLGAEITALWLVKTEIDAIFATASFTASEAGARLPIWATYKEAFQTPTAVSTATLIWAPAMLAIIGRIAARFRPLQRYGNWIWGAGLAVALWSLLVLVALMTKPLIVLATQQHNVFWPGLVMLTGSVLLVLQGFLVKFFGDVARYTLPSPGNIVSRQKVRDRGVALINKLTATGRYDRIVLVAHSLGCLIAYDILCLLWADYVASRTKSGAFPEAGQMPREIQDVIDAASQKPLDVRQYRCAQRALFRALQKADRQRLGEKPDAEDANARWLISDLVTIANPLTHSEFLLAPTKKQLDDRFKWRELSRCPPRLDDSDGVRSFVHPTDLEDASRFNHDAVFSAVRWTSIHDSPEDPRLFLSGDFISGPVAGIFGHGIVDVKVQPRWKSAMPERVFTHTIYWELKQASYGHLPRSVRVIRNAVNILDEDAREEALLSDARRSGASSPA